MVQTIITIVVVGLIAGLLARAIVPGKDAMGILPTILLGIVGSALGGLLAHFVPALSFPWSAEILAVVGAIIVLLIYNRFVAKKA
jgi:uncharacterized membrane protein YeaQ/YmgE (transglycosylase-associated protein family)